MLLEFTKKLEFEDNLEEKYLQKTKNQDFFHFTTFYQQY